MNWAGDAGVWSSWLNTAAYDGIVAVPVALLMIGGEFDLSAGVMIGSSGLLLGILTTQADWNIWPAIAVVLLFGIAIGCLNGFTVTKTRLPSFIVTLGTFFMLRGLNAGATIKITGGVSINNIDAASGFAFAHKLFASIVWPQYGLLGRGALVAGAHGGGSLAPVAHPLRQLDLQLRRRPGLGPERRRPRRADQVERLNATALILLAGSGSVH